MSKLAQSFLLALAVDSTSPVRGSDRAQFSHCDLPLKGDIPDLIVPDTHTHTVIIYTVIVAHALMVISGRKTIMT